MTLTKRTIYTELLSELKKLLLSASIFAELELIHEPIPSFHQKNEYPVDFQVFMEIFGKTQLVGTYLIVAADRPYKLSDVYDSDYFCVFGEVTPEEIVFDTQASNCNVVATDVDSNIICYIASDSGLKFNHEMSSYTLKTNSFIEYFIVHILSEISEHHVYRKINEISDLAVFLEKSLEIIRETDACT